MNTIKRFLADLLQKILAPVLIPVLSGPIIRKENPTIYSLLKSTRVKVTEEKFVVIQYPFALNDLSIGKFSYIAQNSSISLTSIGRYCSIGPNFLCGWGIHPTNGISTSPLFYSKNSPLGITYAKEAEFVERKPIVIGNDVFIGANVTVLDGITIGDGAIIGAGAVVTKDIPPYAIAVGVPATIQRFRFDETTIRSLIEIQWWNREDISLAQISEYCFDVKSFIKLVSE